MVFIIVPMKRDYAATIVATWKYEKAGFEKFEQAADEISGKTLEVICMRKHICYTTK